MSKNHEIARVLDVARKIDTWWAGIAVGHEHQGGEEARLKAELMASLMALHERETANQKEKRATPSASAENRRILLVELSGPKESLLTEVEYGIIGAAEDAKERIRGVDVSFTRDFEPHRLGNYMALYCDSDSERKLRLFEFASEEELTALKEGVEFVNDSAIEEVYSGLREKCPKVLAEELSRQQAAEEGLELR
jgi:hypothetical protein